ncbi:MAG: hypothetical protein ACE5MM_01140 [Nitrospiraceae bacterium]
MKGIRIIAFVLVFVFSTMSFGADDPSIKGETRMGIQSAMKSHIDENVFNGKYLVYDAVEGKLKQLTLKKLHEGIVKKAEYYVSCADFVDNQGNLYDLDLLVVQQSGDFRVLETVVHSINGNKRKYHLEDK